MSLTTLYDEASLWMTPSSASDGKLYSQLPTDGSGDFTFSRGSNLAATRVDVNGLIEKGYENTLLGSNDWAQSDSQYEITGGEVGYDGTNDAWLVNKLAAAYFSKDALVLTGVHTISFYAKAGSLDRIFVFISGDAARFDLTNATAVIAGGNPVSQNIELVSGTTDWYRCSIVVNKTSTQNFLIKPQNSSNQDVTGTIYIQDAQLNQGLVAYPYLETTTAPVAGGVLENEPRLDYSGGASCPSLLLEPSRTQLIPHTEYINSGGGWSYTGGLTTEVNSIDSPEGVKNGTKVVIGSNQYGELRSASILQSATTSTISMFAKAGDLDWCIFQYSDSTVSNYVRVWFNISTGAVGSNTQVGWSIVGTPTNEAVGTDGWYRCSIVLTTTATDTNRMVVFGATGDNAFGATENSYFYTYGAQVEVGSYPTSYIPTYGTSQTRSNESSTTVFSDLISTQAFTMFFEHKSLGMSGTSWAYALEMADGSDEIEFYVNSGAGMNIYLGGNGGYVFGTSSNDGYRAGLTSKVALSYDGDKLSYFINGSLYDSATGVSFNDVNTYLNLRGSRNIALKQSLVFPTALTDSECIALTIDGLKEDIIASYKTRATTLESGAEDRLDTYLQELEDFIIV